MNDKFNVKCPVLPVKGYTLDIPLNTPEGKECITLFNKTRTHYLFKDKAFVAVFLNDDKLRIAAFGDLSGIDKSFDPRRVKYLINGI